MRYIGLAVIALGITVATAQSASYPDLPYNGPASRPDFPDEFEFAAFNPPVTNLTPNVGAPAIAEWTRSNEPGDTMVLTAELLGAEPSFMFCYGSSNCLIGELRTLDEGQAAVTVPPTLPVNGMYFMWPSNESGYGEPVAINQTDAWWVGPNRVSKGKTVSIYGQNLQLGNAASYLYIEELDTWLSSSTSNPYKADFVLPSDMTNGTYTLWSHNGHGREYGWGKSLSLSIISESVWTDNIINVKDAPYNAKGDNFSDDWAAINAAFEAAQSTPYSTVYFPPGTYLVGNILESYKENVRIIGAGADVTKLTTHPSFASAPRYSYMFYIRGDNVVVEDIAFDTGAYIPEPVGRLEGGAVLVEGQNRTQLNTVFKNVVFDSRETTKRWGDRALDVKHVSNFYMTNCTFYISGEGVAFFDDGNQVFADNCTFYGVWDANSLLSGSFTGLSVQNCLGRSYDDSDVTYGDGWAKGRFITTELGTHNVYIGDNTTSNMAPREPDAMFSASPISFSSRTDIDGTWGRITATFNDIPDSLPVFRTDRMIISVVTALGSELECEVESIDLIADTVTFRIRYDNDDPNDLTQTMTLEDQPDHNSGEQIMSEGGESYYRGQVISSTSNTVEFANLSSHISEGEKTRWFATIVKGKGLGQMRRIESVSGEILVMDEPWKVIPDSTSVMTIGRYARNWVVYSNYLDAVSRGYYPTASAGFQISGSAHTMIADGNVFDETLTGIANYSESHRTWVATTNAVSPIFFTLYRNNQLINNGEEGALSVVSIDTDNGAVDTFDDMGLLGNVWRDNYIDNTPVAYAISSPVIHHSGIRVYDSNSATNFVTAVQDSSTQDNQVWVESSADPISPLPPPDPPPAPVLTGITISGPSSVAEGAAVQYVCTASYSDGASAQVSPTWTHNSDHADIDGNGELSAGDVAADENMTVTASYGGYTDTHDVTIRDIPVVLTGITISGPSSVNEGTSERYTCNAIYSDGTSATVSPTWSMSSSYAGISASGELNTYDVLSDQSVTITASFDGQSDTHVVTIAYVPPVLTGLTISGSASLNEGKTEQFTCAASYSDGTSAVVVPEWSVSLAYASISASGLLSAGNVAADQVVTVTATLGGQTDTHAVTILYVAPTLSDITISGPSSVTEGTSKSYTCTANYSDGTSAVVVPQWGVSPSYATINTAGKLNAGNVTADQNITVSATYSGKSDTHAVVISYMPPAITSLVIAGPESVEENAMVQYVCTAHYSDGSSTEVAPSWSANSAYALIDGTGFLSTVNVSADEQVTVEASLNGHTAFKNVLITAVGDQVVVPLSGFEGKTVSAELWDDATQEKSYLGEEYEPEEIVIENVKPDQWYWLGLREYDDVASEWVLVHGRWFWM